MLEKNGSELIGVMGLPRVRSQQRMRADDDARADVADDANYEDGHVGAGNL